MRLTAGRRVTATATLPIEEAPSVDPEAGDSGSGGGAPSAEELKKVIEHCGGNLSKVARYYGKDRRQVYRWIERLGLGTPRED